MKMYFIKLLDTQIIICLIMVVAACKFGQWRNWKSYYPTILYFIIGNLVYAVISIEYPLWNFESNLLSKTFSNLVINFIFFPSTIILYLTYMPTKLIKQILYIVLCTVVYTIIESIWYYTGCFSYHNGWNIGWSALFNSIMFPLLWLHYKKPLLVWPISFVVALLLLYFFKVPMK